MYTGVSPSTWWLSNGNNIQTVSIFVNSPSYNEVILWKHVSVSGLPVRYEASKTESSSHQGENLIPKKAWSSDVLNKSRLIGDLSL